MTAETTTETASAQEAPSVFGELSGMEFLKGHGTGNDFVLVVDPDGQLLLGDDVVRRACDRHQGIGGDGFIRLIRSSALPEGRELLEQDPSAEWFMDYRNGDGSIAEMCGNGVRVFVRALLQQGLVDLGRAPCCASAPAAASRRSPPRPTASQWTWGRGDSSTATGRASGAPTPS